MLPSSNGRHCPAVVVRNEVEIIFVPRHCVAGYRIFGKVIKYCRVSASTLSLAVVLAISLLAASAFAAIETFKVRVEGVDDSAFADSIVAVSQLSEFKDRSLPTRRALRELAQSALPRIDKLLRSRAFYDGKVDFTIEGEDPPTVVLKVEPGPAYLLTDYRVLSVTGERTPIEIPMETLGIAIGKPAVADKIVEAETRIIGVLGRRSFPLARIQDHRVVVDHEARSVSVTVNVDTGPYARYGATRIEGLADVSPSIVTRHIRWTQGEPYDTATVDATTDKLRETGLFGTVRIRPDDKVDAKGEIAMSIQVEEKKHRSVGIGGSFSTTEGLLGKLIWGHRNLLGNGESFRARAEVGEIRQGVFGDLRVADVGTLDQDIVFDFRAVNETNDTFTSLETVTVARVERRFGSVYSGSAGIGYDLSSVEDNLGDTVFNYAVFPLTLRRDTSDDLLDPGKGGRDSLSVTPTVGLGGTHTNFVVTRLFDSVYYSLLPKKELVLAGWARLGTILGEQTFDIPANKRLFAGGPGSVRGYGLNTIGPLDAPE